MKTIILIFFLLLAGCSLLVPPCNRQICPDIKKILVSNVFDNYTSETFKILPVMEVKDTIIKGLISKGASVPEECSITMADNVYIGYREDIITQARVSIPPMYDYELFLEKRIPGYDWLEASDCDNKAEWIVMWLHWSLPNCAAFTIESTNHDKTLIHRYSGIVTNNKNVIWYSGDPANFRYNVCSILCY